MENFKYEIVRNNGKKVKGKISANSIAEAVSKLRDLGINIEAAALKPAGFLDRDLSIGTGRVSFKELTLFTRQFSTMIDAGLPIVHGLRILAGQAKGAFRDVLVGVRETVEQGGSLAEGLSKYPKVFDDLYVNMVVAGEAGGILDTILERLSLHLEKAMKLRREVITALIYPSVVISAAIIVTSILLIFVIPTFADLFNDFGQELPGPTLFVMGISNFFVAYWWAIFGLLIAALVGFFQALQTARGKRIIHPIFLALPIFGDLFRKVAVARFTRTLSTMLTSGVPMLAALEICAKTAGNVVVEGEVKRTRTSVSEGNTLTAPLEDSTVFPQMVVQMISVGESTGALDAMLSKIAEFYESEVETAVGALKQLIEPVMILILGTLIGGLVVAMYLPIFKLGAISGS